MGKESLENDQDQFLPSQTDGAEPGWAATRKTAHVICAVLPRLINVSASSPASVEMQKGDIQRSTKTTERRMWEGISFRHPNPFSLLNSLEKKHR